MQTSEGSGPGGALLSRSYDAVLQWALLVAATCFGLVVLWDFGFVAYIYANDTSRVSMLISAIFVAMSGYCLFKLVDHSRELRSIEEITTFVEEKGATLDTSTGGLAVGSTSYGVDRPVADILRDVAILRRNGSGDANTLLESFAWQMRLPGRRGIFVSDSLYKLGMLGTVIGFIAMLVSMRDLGDFEPETMRDALRQMTGGMAVALLTTITGLICGLLLRLQFNILDLLAMRVLRRTVRLTELFVPASRNI